MNVLLLILICLLKINCLKVRDVVFLILSQENEYNSGLAIKLKQQIIQNNESVVYLSHKDFSHVGDWTVIPLIPNITKNHDYKWIFICNEQTNVVVNKLLKILDKYNHEEEVWLGYALKDQDASIIHHFAFFNNPETFYYPNIASGFAISYALAQKLTQQIIQSQNNKFEATEFSIDASHELALFIWENGNGVSLKHEPTFCTTKKQNCATFVNSFTPCGAPVPLNSIYFAVKTYHKYIKRIDAIKKTWEKYAQHIEYFSDKSNKTIPTVSFGIPNTERGHCAKTIAILHHFINLNLNQTNIKWIVIVDDDTIISPGRVRRLLSCYTQFPDVAIGERYGYRVQDISNIGYNYITGGGGMIFSKQLVKQLITEKCECPKPDTPDDMYIGICLAQLGIKIIHSPHFHQARPNDYAHDYLSKNDAISFHKHWMNDPVQVYQEWFQNADEFILNSDYKTEL